jgi:RNA polymerase sigma-70 factor (ECF subfamily)
VRGGDADAYADLVSRHAPVAVRTAALLGAGPEAEDVVQEAFVKAYGALSRFRDGAAFRPWLLRIVVNETRNLHRAAGRRHAREREAWERTMPLLAAVDADQPAAAALSRERRSELHFSIISPPGFTPGSRPCASALTSQKAGILPYLATRYLQYLAYSSGSAPGPKTLFPFHPNP